MHPHVLASQNEHVSEGGLVQPQVLASQQVVGLRDILVASAPRGKRIDDPLFTKYINTDEVQILIECRV